MSFRNELKRYELFGWDYELVSPLTDAEVAWHQMWANRTGGPLLGLACGTGRLLCRLAEAGFEVVGVDLSDAMLAIARRNIANLPADAQRRVRLIKADMASLGLGQQFGLIFIADNSFRELPTRKALLACLRRIRRHLRPEGKLLITERRFDPATYPDGRRSGWSDPWRHPRTGEMVSRRFELHLSKDQKRAHGAFEYKTTHADGTETIERCPWSAPMLQKAEYIDLFARAGFEAQTFVGCGEVEDDGEGRILCFVCEAKR